MAVSTSQRRGEVLDETHGSKARKSRCSPHGAILAPRLDSPTVRPRGSPGGVYGRWPRPSAPSCPQPWEGSRRDPRLPRQHPRLRGPAAPPFASRLSRGALGRRIDRPALGGFPGAFMAAREALDKTSETGPWFFDADSRLLNGHCPHRGVGPRDDIFITSSGQSHHEAYRPPPNPATPGCSLARGPDHPAPRRSPRPATDRSSAIALAL
jgi:hypothetical protein